MNVDDVRARINEELDSIILKAPPCPDPWEGGCIGDHCIYCSARQLQGYLAQVELVLKRAEPRKTALRNEEEI